MAENKQLEMDASLDYIAVMHDDVSKMLDGFESHLEGIFKDIK